MADVQAVCGRVETDVAREMLTVRSFRSSGSVTWWTSPRNSRSSNREPMDVAGVSDATCSSAEMSARIHGPRSSGVRAEIRFPSTTVSESTQSTPALTMSSRIAPTLVARRPFKIPAEIGTHPAWHMKATGFSGGVEGADEVENRLVPAELVGREAPWHDQSVEVAFCHLLDGCVHQDRPVALLPGDRRTVDTGEDDLHAFFSQPVERIEELHVLEQICGEDEDTSIRSVARWTR